MKTERKYAIYLKDRKKFDEELAENLGELLVAILGEDVKEESVNGMDLINILNSYLTDKERKVLQKCFKLTDALGRIDEVQLEFDVNIKEIERIENIAKKKMKYYLSNL